MTYLPKEDILKLYKQTHDFGFVENMSPYFKSDSEFIAELIKETPEKTIQIINKADNKNTIKALAEMEKQGIFKNSEVESKKQKIQVEEHSL